MSNQKQTQLKFHVPLKSRVRAQPPIEDSKIIGNAKITEKIYNYRMDNLQKKLTNFNSTYANQNENIELDIDFLKNSDKIELLTQLKKNGYNVNTKPNLNKRDSNDSYDMAPRTTIKGKQNIVVIN